MFSSSFSQVIKLQIPNSKESDCFADNFINGYFIEDKQENFRSRLSIFH